MYTMHVQHIYVSEARQPINNSTYIVVLTSLSLYYTYVIIYLPPLFNMYIAPLSPFQYPYLQYTTASSPLFNTPSPPLLNTHSHPLFNTTDLSST